MEFETPEQYKERFEERVEKFVENFGTRREFVEDQIELIKEEIDYIERLDVYIVDSGEYRSLAFEKLIGEIGRDRYYGASRRKIEFLNEQLTGAPNLINFEGRLSFKHDRELVELAHTLYRNGNWKGDRIDLIRILSYLSKRKINKSDKIVDALKNRSGGPIFLYKLSEAYEEWQKE